LILLSFPFNSISTLSQSLIELKTLFISTSNLISGRASLSTRVPPLYEYPGLSDMVYLLCKNKSIVFSVMRSFLLISSKSTRFTEG
jgi:hypothetical protein